MFGPSPATKSPKRACFQHDFEEHHAYHPDAMHSTYSLWFFYYASGRSRTIICSKQHHSKQLQQLQATFATPEMLMNGDIPGRYRWPKLCHETMRVGYSGSIIFICYSLNYMLLVFISSLIFLVFFGWWFWTSMIFSIVEINLHVINHQQT